MDTRNRGVLIVFDAAGTARYVASSLTDLSGCVQEIAAGTSPNARLNAYVQSGQTFEIVTHWLPNAPESEIGKRAACLLLQYGRADRQTGTLWNRDGDGNTAGALPRAA